MNRYDKKHLTNLALYGRRVDEIYKEAIKRAGQLGINLRGFNPNKPFSFADYPIAKKKADKLVEWLHRGLTEVISAGVSEEWALSNEKNDEYVDKAFGASAWRFPDVMYRQYYNTNGAAENAFLARKQGGLGLSDRVWQYSERFKDEIELGLDLGIRAGRSADQISRDIRLYLQHPDKLFRRVKVEMKNENDEPLWRLSKAAELEHPGRGVYRSSYKNARRLAVTETNMAYRAADHERWQQLDFILGQHVILSKRHSEEDGIEDMCDELSGKDENDKRGRYPKEFKFTGWHPLCRCYVVPIMLTPEEMKAKAQATINGEEYTPKSQPITDMPEEYKQWVERNTDRIAKAEERGTLPRFVEDGQRIVEEAEQNNKRHITHDQFVGSIDGKEQTVKVLQDLSNRDNIERIPFGKLDRELSQSEIIRKVSGGDLTDGSCSSVALAYIANKQGYDVLDFRGGASWDYFSSMGKIRNIASMFDGEILIGIDDLKNAKSILRTIVKGEEYYFACGRHASIVRLGEDGLEYLEAQNAKANKNGFYKLNTKALKARFKAQTRHTEEGIAMDGTVVLIPSSNFKNKETEFRDLLEYINTKQSNQEKGLGGTTK